ncbi:hypothetical protein ACEN4K_12490, partial [Marinilactibacillus psychrotolerans]|uniref:hypothetical protein n=1 Tax=Marinilactibacillus psychrotolerans TaxID=191770 RepID=UPI00388B2EEE
VILRLFTEGERLAEPISLSKQRKTIKGKSDSRDFLQQLDTHYQKLDVDVFKIGWYSKYK